MSHEPADIAMSCVPTEDGGYVLRMRWGPDVEQDTVQASAESIIAGAYWHADIMRQQGWGPFAATENDNKEDSEDE